MAYANLVFGVVGLAEFFRPRCDFTFADVRTREAVEHEVADVMMLLLEFAASTGIDVTRAVEAKLAINAQRYPVDKSRGRATKYDRLDEAR